MTIQNFLSEAIFFEDMPNATDKEKAELFKKSLYSEGCFNTYNLKMFGSYQNCLSNHLSNNNWFVLLSWMHDNLCHHFNVNMLSPCLFCDIVQSPPLAPLNLTLCVSLLIPLTMAQCRNGFCKASLTTHSQISNFWP